MLHSRDPRVVGFYFLFVVIGLLFTNYPGGKDEALGVVVDATDSTGFLLTNPAQAQLAGGRDGFVMTLDPAGSGLTSSSCLGGAADDQATSIAVGAAGDLFPQARRPA